MFSYIRGVFFLALAILFFGSASLPLSAQVVGGPIPYSSGNLVKDHTSPQGQNGSLCATPHHPGSADDSTGGPSCEEGGPGVASYWISKPGRYQARNGDPTRCYLDIFYPQLNPQLYVPGEQLIRGAISSAESSYPESDSMPEQWWQYNESSFLWIKAIEKHGLISAFFELFSPSYRYFPGLISPVLGPPPYFVGSANSERASCSVEFELVHNQNWACNSSDGSLWGSRFRTGQETKRLVPVKWFRTKLRLLDGREITLKPMKDSASEVHYLRTSSLALDPPPDDDWNLGGIGWTWDPWNLSIGTEIITVIPKAVDQVFDLHYATDPEHTGRIVNGRAAGLEVRIRSFAQCVVEAKYYSSQWFWNVFPGGIRTRSGVVKSDEATPSMDSALLPHEQLHNEPLLLPRDGIVEASNNVLVSTLWNGCDSSCFLIDLEGFLYDPDAITPQRYPY